MDGKGAYEKEITELRRQFAVRFRRMREDGFRSQEAFADRARLHRTTVGDLEQGKTDPPLSTLLIIADALQIPPERLMEGLPIPKQRKPPPPLPGKGRPRAVRRTPPSRTA